MNLPNVPRASAKSGYGFACRVNELADSPGSAVLAGLTSAHVTNSPGDLSKLQIKAWEQQIGNLQRLAGQFQAARADAADWLIVFEYDIPRRGKRIDTLIVTDRIIFVLEFKVGTRNFAAQDKRQVEDYALELADFHASSHDRLLWPILIATGADAAPQAPSRRTEFVQDVACCTVDTLAAFIVGQHDAAADAPTIDPAAWLGSPYTPTPTIIEAAQRLYSHHTVSDITRNEAEVKNLAQTQAAIHEAIAAARATRSKIICFVTGIPGAGKTLAGLNATVSVDQDEEHLAVYLSGNGPLVAVLSEALARDEQQRTGTMLGEARRRTGQFVQGVHRYINNYLNVDSGAPAERIVVFDEAQRAWSRERCRQKVGRDESEPASMLRIMDRHMGWAVLVGLVGGGQEINTGEAGLREWGHAIEERFPHWSVRVSPILLTGGDSAIGQTLFQTPPATVEVVEDPRLHLAVSVRSYRSTAVADWVAHVLNNHPTEAARAAERLRRFPLKMTRSLDTARAWLRERARGSRRCGLVASSGGKRLRRFGVEVEVKVKPEHWFLDDHTDVRSSLYLETAATEFDVQGLELDWVCMCWDADLRRVDGAWREYKFKGSKWQAIKQPADLEFLRNKYRVLLTRAREGIIIWVPPGDASDPTTPPQWYDAIAEYLAACGVEAC